MRSPDKSGTLKLQAFGGDAELKAITNAIARFNKEYPNVKVEVLDRPDLDRLGRLRHQGARRSSTPASAADVYGTAIETFQAFASRGLFLPLDDYVKANTGFSDFAPSLFEQASYKGKIYYIPIGWNNIMINYNRDLFDKAGVPYPEGRLDLGRVPRGGQDADRQGRLRQRHPVRLRGAEPELLRAALVPHQRTPARSMPTGPRPTCSTPRSPRACSSCYDLIHVDGVSPIPGKDTMDNQFFAGQVAMINRGHWIIQSAKKRQAQHGHRRSCRPRERHDGDRLRRLRGRQDTPRIPTSPRRWSRH